MRRAEWLIPYSHDHQHGLAQALRLRRAAEADDPVELARRVDDLLRFADDELLDHLRREEQDLLPTLRSNDLVSDEDADRLLAEHDALRAQLAHVADAPTNAAAAGRLATTLHDHIRWEERVLFERAQRSIHEFPTT